GEIGAAVRRGGAKEARGQHQHAAFEPHHVGEPGRGRQPEVAHARRSQPRLLGRDVEHGGKDFGAHAAASSSTASSSTSAGGGGAASTAAFIAESRRSRNDSAISGFSTRNAHALSRPCAIRSPSSMYQAPDFSSSP